LIKQLTDWLNDRSGYRSLIKKVDDEPIPGGARWRYVFGSAITAAFLIQAFTGVLLMTSYSPSSSMAWASVFYIKEQLWMGWFIRGVHHFSAQTLMTLLPFHLLQVVWAGAYRRPRELTWWFGLALLFMAAAFSLTGYLLPWDQKGYWHARVATNIMGSAPLIGPYFLRVLIGGADYGNLTVTHFYGLHVAILPILFVLCLVAHIVLARRYGLTPPPGADRRPAGKYWPDQVFRNVVACAVVLGVIVTLVLIEGGTTLEAPADPSSSDYPARPEWYFLSLFQMLKMFPGRIEVVGTFVIPSCLAILLASLPLWDRVLPRTRAHFLARAFVFAVVGAAGVLTFQALYSDAHDTAFQAAREKADAARQRAIYLAGLPDVGIPPDGSGYLLRRDPLTQGQNVLQRRCLGCHFYEGKGSGEQTASDLARFGSRTWIRGLLEKPTSSTYFGKAAKFDGMVEWKKSSKLSAKELDDVADFVASFAAIPDDLTIDDWANSPGVSEHPGAAPFQKECGKCHVIDGFTDGGLRDAPGLFGWGSRWWTARMIRKPRSSDKYGFVDEKQENQMPAFGPDQIIASDLDALVRYLKDDYARPPASDHPTE
jgi:quinol-cytochrome oxidoreductase complex cytochrome b subunit/mono/diheme cytochrome c family protein